MSGVPHPDALCECGDPAWLHVDRGFGCFASDANEPYRHPCDCKKFRPQKLPQQAPPLGVEPDWFWREKRIKALLEAALRHVEDGRLARVEEWLNEAAGLVHTARVQGRDVVPPVFRVSAQELAESRGRLCMHEDYREHLDAALEAFSQVGLDSIHPDFRETVERVLVPVFNGVWNEAFEQGRKLDLSDNEAQELARRPSATERTER